MTNSLLPTYYQYPITMTKGSGSHVWDSDGKQYLDLYGGHAVCLVGHCPPPVIEAIEAQSKKLMFYSNVFATEPNQVLADKIVSTLAPDKYQLYCANSGSEANEEALKIARKYTGRTEVISFHNAWHGRAVSTFSVTGFTAQHGFDPNLLEYTHFVDFGDIDAVEKAMNENTAAVILEPIQSIGGVNKAVDSFYTELAKLCKQNRTLLIFDEVQTGIGRTGDWWFAQSVGVKPDIITTAKGIASGLPLSLVLIEETISSTIPKGAHATTFGGGPVVCAAAIATLDLITQHKDSARPKFEYIQNALSKLPQVKAIKGQGMLIGIELSVNSDTLVKTCLELGLIIGPTANPYTARLMPSLTISYAEIDTFVDIFTQALNQQS